MVLTDSESDYEEEPKAENVKIESPQSAAQSPAQSPPASPFLNADVLDDFMDAEFADFYANCLE